MPISNPVGEIGTDSLFSSELSPHGSLDFHSQSNPGEPLYLTDISSGDKPWDIHKKASEVVSRLYSETQFRRYGFRIERCARCLEFAVLSAERGEFDFKLLYTWFCRVRHCPICQWRRELMWRARFFKRMPSVIQDYPTARYLSLTLTVRNCPVSELRETIKLMNKAWKRLIGRKDFPAIGFVKSLEVTKEQKTEGYAHPHFHCLLMVKSSYFSTGYLPKDKWIQLWQDCLGVDYRPSIYIKPVTPKKGANIGEVEGLIWGICETLKYTVKVQDLVADPEWLGEITRQMYKLRAVSVGGVLKEYLSEDDPEDLIHGDVETEKELKNAAILPFDWATEVKRYASQFTR